eukprot:15048758-Alexandrium_andersonii.AAC.1
MRAWGLVCDDDKHTRGRAGHWGTYGTAAHVLPGRLGVLPRRQHAAAGHMCVGVGCPTHHRRTYTRVLAGHTCAHGGLGRHDTRTRTHTRAPDEAGARAVHWGTYGTAAHVLPGPLGVLPQRQRAAAGMHETDTRA